MFKYIVCILGGDGFGCSRLFLCLAGKPRREKRAKVGNPIKQRNMKKAISFIKIVGYVLGAIGGVGWSLYNGSYAVAAGCVILAWLAWPELKKSIDNLTE
jgi:hypothetical protein